MGWPMFTFHLRGMTRHSSAVCLVSFVLINEPTTAVSLFVRGSGGRVRPRRSRCSTPRNSDNGGERRRHPRVSSPPARSRTPSRLDVDECSVESPLLKLKVARAIPASRSRSGVGSAQQALFNIHDMRMRCAVPGIQRAVYK